MVYLFAAFLILILLFVSHFYRSLLTLRAAEIRPAARNLAGRYRPMLRLLSDDDLGSVPVAGNLRKTARAARRKIFREYLNYLTEDYTQVLAELRAAMAGSAVDRPDLGRALARNEFLFTLAVYKIKYRLVLHAAQIGSVEISALVRAFDTVQIQVAGLSAMRVAASA